MLEFLARLISLRKNVNFWDWVRNSYSEKELQRLINEATDCSLIEIYNPFDNATMNQSKFGFDNRRNSVKALMNRYGTEIWHCCLGAGGYDPDEGRVGIQCLSKLDLAFQVHDQKTFEEFLVRNALKRTAQQIIEGEKRVAHP